MVAYSFQKRFVQPIRRGIEFIYPDVHPKLQTIRAIGKRRHARPGEVIQLYCGMRTRNCFKIGEARCTRVDDIEITVGEYIIAKIEFPDSGDTASKNKFAKADGFDDIADMHRFWKDAHGVGVFRGLLIRWEPL